MTLKDKLQVEIMDLPIMDEVIDDIGTNLEYVVDNFAIGFADWLNNIRFSQYGNSWIDPRKNKNKDGDWLFFSSKQLLETYKKENGL